MRFEKGHKAETRKRIVDVASKRFRKDGVEAVGIAGLMADAGLTHGGFYAHFGSKEELVREALAAAMEASVARRARVLEDENSGLEGLVRFYLRPAHRDTPALGCAVASLIDEIARHDDATRQVFADRLGDIVDQIAGLLPPALPEAERKSTAIGIFGVMLGTLQMARAVVDKTLSDSILESGVRAALRLADG